MRCDAAASCAAADAAVAIVAASIGRGLSNARKGKTAKMEAPAAKPRRQPVTASYQSACGLTSRFRKARHGSCIRKGE